MEDQARLAANRPLVLSTFQVARFLEPELRRYRRLARRAQLVAVFAQGASTGVDPARDGVLPVDLAYDDPLCHEWHVVLVADNFMALLLCRELPGQGPPTVDRVADLDRRFEGVWTFEPEIVRYAAAQFLPRVRDAWPGVPLPPLERPDAGAAAMPFVQPLTTCILRGLETAISDERARRRELQESYDLSMRMLGGAVEAKDHNTGEHVHRVMTLAEQIGARLGWPEATLRDLRYGAALHDIGKIGIPEAILTKPGALDDTEVAVMREHPTIGARILEDVPFLARAAAAVRHHHERWDGKGYPDRLAGEQIPAIAHVVAIADVFDALRSDRPYRTGWPLERVLSFMEEQRGTAFDPELVDILLEIVRAPDGEAGNRVAALNGSTHA